MSIEEQVESLELVDLVTTDGAERPLEDVQTAALIVAQHDALQRGVQHLGNQSVAIRGVASAWILGSLSAVGLLLKETETLGAGAVVESKVAVLLAIVLLAGAGGLLLLWGLDRRFNYRLLDSVFVVAIALERAYPRLLVPSGRLMARSTHSRIVHLFYLCPAWGFTIAGLAMTRHGHEKGAAGLLLAGSIAISVVVFLSIAIVTVLAWGSATIDDVVRKWRSLVADIWLHEQ